MPGNFQGLSDSSECSIVAGKLSAYELINSLKEFRGVH